MSNSKDKVGFALSDDKKLRLFQDRVIDNRHITMTEAINYLLMDESVKSLDVAVGYF